MTTTSPPDRRPRRAASRQATRLAAALAVAAVLGTACTDDGGGTVDSAGAATGAPADPTTTTTTGGLSEDARELLEDYALDEADCTERDVSGAGAVAALTCDLDPVTYDITRYEDAAALRAGFGGIVDENEAETRRWWYDSDPDVVMGQMFSVAEAGTAHIHWTNEDELVVGHASRPGRANLEALEEWWGSDGSTPEEQDAAPAAFTAGDCVDLPASGAGGEPVVVDCGDAAAEAEVLSVSTGTTEPDCGADSDRSYGLETTDADGDTQAYALCLASLAPAVDPADSDGVLAVGSCLQAVPDGPDSHTITEYPCGDPLVTHQVTASVAEGAPCPANEPLSFNKSDAEVTASGPGAWCLALH